MIGLLGLHILQNGTMNSFRSRSEETINKRDYYKLLKLKPMFIKLNVSPGHGKFLPQLINVSMIKEIRGGYRDIDGLTPDKWCTAKFIDGEELYVEGSIDDLQNTIWREEEINKK